MIYSVTAQASFIALIATTLFVLWAGDRWGRLSGLLHAANWALVSLLQKRHEAQTVFQTSDFVVEVIGAVLACVIAVKSRQVWAALLAAFQLLGVVNYLVVLFDDRVRHRAFWTAEYIWEAGDILCLVAAGVYGLRGRRAAKHLDPSYQIDVG